MADYNITVSIDPAGVKRGGRQVRGELGRIEQRGNQTGKTLARFFSFAAIATGLTGTIRLLANFEQEMATVRAITGATGRQFAELRQEAQRLGSTTRFSATQAAEGMVFLSRAGFDVNETLDATGQVLTLAQAGALDLGRAADIASNVLQGFNIAASESQRAVDVLALAANSANTNVEQLGQAMSFVAPASAGMGISIEETAAAVSVLSDAGIQATRAGTGLRQIFIQLAKAGGEFDIQQRGLVPVLETLRKKLLDAETGQINLAEAAELVGARQSSSLSVLIRSIEKFVELTGAYENAEGAAQQISDTMDSQLKGALFAVRSAAEGLILAIGESGATDALEQFFRSVATGLRTLTANIDAVVAGLKVLLSLILGRLIVAIGTGLVSVLVKATAAMQGLAKATALARLAALGPVVAAVGVALLLFIDRSGITEKRVEQFNKTLGDLDETMNRIAGSTGEARQELKRFALGQIEADVNSVETEIGRLEERLKDVPGIYGVVSDALGLVGVETKQQLQRQIEDLEDFLDELLARRTNIVLPTTAEIREATRRRETQVPGGAGDEIDTTGRAALIERELELLDREAQALRLVGDERKVLEEQLRIEDKIRKELKDANENLTEAELNNLARLSDAEAQAVEQRVRRNAQLEREADVLDAIQGPQRDYELRLQALNSLLEKGRISQAEFNEERERSDPVLNQIRLLDQEARLLQVTGDAREILAAKIALEEQLRRRLTAEEERSLALAIRRNLKMEREASLLDELRAPQEEFRRRLEALDALYEQSAISAALYNDELRRMELQALATDRSLEGGARRGLLRLQDVLTDTGRHVEEALVNTFRNAEDALVEFVTTGKLAFGDFVNSLIADLARLAIRQSILGPLSTLLLGDTGGQASGGGSFSHQAVLADVAPSLLPGGQHGAEFVVGGFGGVDNNTLSVNGQPRLRVSRGERVIVQPRDGGGGRPIHVHMTINTPDANSFRRSQGQIMADAFAAAWRAAERDK